MMSVILTVFIYSSTPHIIEAEVSSWESCLQQAAVVQALSQNVTARCHVEQEM